MTGFGKALCKINNKFFFIEIKSLNSKQLDVFMRLPSLYKEKEISIRNLLNENLKRGKIELTIRANSNEQAKKNTLNFDLLENYHKQLLELNERLSLNSSDNEILNALLNMPDVFLTKEEELDPEEWQAIAQSLQTALREIKQFREQEGTALEKDITLRISKIQELLAQIPPFEHERTQRVKERILQHLNEFVNQETVDKERFEQELIYYIEKFDITEEKVRLRNHCDYFLNSISDKSPVGKKLGFISQEIGREINTIGSKANHVAIQQIVVQMKDELEKIKEQLLNVL